jgi:hypothetical protein
VCEERLTIAKVLNTAQDRVLELACMVAERRQISDDCLAVSQVCQHDVLLTPPQ